jgi:hypothetical protein
MAVTTEKLSQIPAAASPPAPTDTLIGVSSGVIDEQFTLAQVAQTVSQISGSVVGMVQQLVSFLPAPVSHTGDTSEVVLASFKVPGNTMGPNGKLVVDMLVSEISAEYLANAPYSYLRIRHLSGIKIFEGLIYSAFLPPVNAALWMQALFVNAGVTGSQVGPSVGNEGPGATVASLTAFTAAIDTTQDQTYVITGQNGHVDQTMTLAVFEAVVTKPLITPVTPPSQPVSIATAAAGIDYTSAFGAPSPAQPTLTQNLNFSANSIATQPARFG